MAPHVFHVLQGREDIRVLRLAEVGNQRSFEASPLGIPPTIRLRDGAPGTDGSPRERTGPDRKEAFAGNAAHVHAGAAEDAASIIKAFAPFRSARIAALKAAAPPPRMIRSCRFAICSTFPFLAFNPSARTHRVDSPTERDLWESLGFCAATTTLSAPNVFVIRLWLSEDDFAK